MVDHIGQPDRRESTLNWAVFLGCSWTWCIGMFLPVLLVRQMGLWGWVVFAVPNVIGAAAMGWVLRSSDASRRLVERHAGACAMFSIVTIAFHAFFVGWIIRAMLGWWGVGGTIVLCFAMWAWRGRGIGWAWVVLLVSVSAFLTVVFSPEIAAAHIPIIRSADALWLAPACILGFALCPYLDLTFHRARQATEGPTARDAFALGFGGVFLLMILFSLIYAPMLAPVIEEGGAVLAPRLRLAIGIHMMVQVALTVALHGRELQTIAVGLYGRELGTLARHCGRGQGEGSARVVIGRVVNWLWLGIAILLSAALSIFAGRHWLGLSGGEVIYRSFMGFYGLIFPAYVWIIVITGGERRPRNWIVLIIAIVAAAPMYWMGFVMGQMYWLPAGVAIILLARAATAVESPSADRLRSLSRESFKQDF